MHNCINEGVTRLSNAGYKTSDHHWLTIVLVHILLTLANYSVSSHPANITKPQTTTG